MIPDMADTMRVLLFAMEGLFSRRIFESLLEAGTRFDGIVLPGSSSITKKPVCPDKLQVLNTESIESLARYHRIPVFYINRQREDPYKDLLALKCPDIILVACFPYLLPPYVFQHTIYGAFNIHPSLLPAYKGPLPLFWQFYFGEMKSGVSIHEIDASFDTGNIVLQQKVLFQDGVSSTEATELLAQAAIELVPLLTEQLVNDQFSSFIQDTRHDSYYSWPGMDQFTIATSWAARRAFNFMCGTRHWHQVYSIVNEHGDEIAKASEAVSYHNGASTTANALKDRNEQLIKFSDGVLVVSL